MGPYCKFCNNRCFCHFPDKTPDYILKAYGTSNIIATCPGGQKFEKEKVGYCYDDIIKAIEEQEKENEPASVNLMSAGYEWACPNCSIHNTETEWKSEVTCENCRHAFSTNPPEHALDIPQKGTKEFETIQKKVDEYVGKIHYINPIPQHYHLFTEHDEADNRPHPYCTVYFGSSFDIDELKERFILNTAGEKRGIIYKTLPDGRLEPAQDFWNIWGDCRGKMVSILTMEQDDNPPSKHVDLMSAGYEWACPSCSIHNTETEWKSKVTCDNCRHEFNTNLPEHALGD